MKLSHLLLAASVLLASCNRELEAVAVSSIHPSQPLPAESDWRAYSQARKDLFAGQRLIDKLEMQIRYATAGGKIELGETLKDARSALIELGNKEQAAHEAVAAKLPSDLKKVCERERMQEQLQQDNMFAVFKADLAIGDRRSDANRNKASSQDLLNAIETKKAALQQVEEANTSLVEMRAKLSPALVGGNLTIEQLRERSK